MKSKKNSNIGKECWFVDSSLLLWEGTIVSEFDTEYVCEMVRRTVGADKTPVMKNVSKDRLKIIKKL